MTVGLESAQPGVACCSQTSQQSAKKKKKKQREKLARCARLACKTIVLLKICLQELLRNGISDDARGRPTCTAN